MTQFDRMAENLLTILPSPNPPKDQRQEDKGDDLASLDSVYDAQIFRIASSLAALRTASKTRSSSSVISFSPTHQDGQSSSPPPSNLLMRSSIRLKRRSRK